eukprot:2130563-Pyramimonas_sp.AAC.1
MAAYGRHEYVDEVHPQPIAAVVSMFETTLDMAVSRGAEGEDGHPGLLHRAGPAHQQEHQAPRRES